MDFVVCCLYCVAVDLYKECLSYKRKNETNRANRANLTIPCQKGFFCFLTNVDYHRKKVFLWPTYTRNVLRIAHLPVPISISPFFLNFAIQFQPYE